MAQAAPQAPDKNLPREKFRWRTQKHLHQMAQLLAVFCAASTRGQIHDLRVLSRRLRAALSVLQRLSLHVPLDEQRKALRQLTKRLGPVRSLDVSLQLLKSRLKQSPLRKVADLSPVLKVLKKRREKALKALEKYRCSPPYSVLWNFCMNKEILSALDLTNFSELLELRLGKATLRLLKAYEKYDLDPRMSRLHRLRIQLKKWRYLSEIRSDCIGPHVPETMDRAKEVQDQLGRLHDLEVLRDELRTRGMTRAIQRNSLIRELKTFDEIFKSEITEGAKNFRQAGGAQLLQIIS